MLVIFPQHKDHGNLTSFLPEMTPMFSHEKLLALKLEDVLRYFSQLFGVL